MFRSVDPQVSFPQLEDRLVAWWRESGVRARSLSGREDGPDFIFFEGPPTANGKPGVHHVLARAFKDIILRYKRMQGFHLIGARGGWDTQGLPVEVQVEKELNLNGKRDIDAYGVAPFNKKCKESVFRYVQDWEAMTDRMAYWVDLDDAYVTYKNDYIESCWWILKSFWDQGLLFRDYKVNMHCPRCVTTLADMEVAQGYKEDTEDPSVWPMFKVKTVDGALPAPLTGLPASIFFLAWTTTPWTLPANVAVALKPDGVYVAAQKGDLVYILAEERLIPNLGEEAEVLRRFTGSELAGVAYEGLYRGVPGAGDEVDWDKAYHAIVDDYVSLDDGTGIVHIAPAYGDLEIGRRHGLPTLFSVDLHGMVLPELRDFEGRFFKEADPLIIRDLKDRGLLYKSGRTKHTYPFCWRCDAPLLFFAKSSWYIRTTARKQGLLDNNEQINWVPEHIKHGRFGNWLENNIDWAISRQRYWGTPMPIWECACGHQECVGSVADLSAKAGKDLSDLDLHRPYVDDITWACPQCGGAMQRVPDLMDVWFDSGAMPTAQWHYPFENKEYVERTHAHYADFICEAIDQTRGWFYSLHATSTLLFDRPAFKNVICLGHILDEKGFKMSKSKGNIVSLDTAMEHGADALRWYMYTCTTPGNPRRFSSNLVGESVRKFLLTLWNTYSFFVTYANLDGVDLAALRNPQSEIRNAMDKWALSRLQSLTDEVTRNLDAYQVTEAGRAIEAFTDTLSNWYLRRNRRRFWKSEADEDKQAAYYTLYTCLVTVAKLMAPFAPFVSEEIYRNLVAEGDAAAPESVHLADWPVVDAALVDAGLDRDMAVLLKVVELGRSARAESGLKVRQPLAELIVGVKSVEEMRIIDCNKALLKDELNVKEVNVNQAGSNLLVYRLKPNLPVVGRMYGKLVPLLKKGLDTLSPADAQRIVFKRDVTQRAIENLSNSLENIGENKLHMAYDEIVSLRANIYQLAQSMNCYHANSINDLCEFFSNMGSSKIVEAVRNTIVSEDESVYLLHDIIGELSRQSEGLTKACYMVKNQNISNANCVDHDLLKYSFVVLQLLNDFIPSVLIVEDEKFYLTPNQLIVEASSIPGYSAVGAEGIVAAVNTILTPELRNEGYVRDLIRCIQDLRKEKRFEIDDKIILFIAASQEFYQSINKYEEYICKETLASEVRRIEELFTNRDVTLDISGYQVSVGVQKSS